MILPLLAACGPKTSESMLSTPADFAPLPEVGESREWAPVVPSEHTLNNGMTVWLLPATGLPLVSLRLVVDGGAATDPKGKAGLCSLSDDLLTHGAGDLDAAAFAELTERLAVDLGASTHRTATVLHLDATTENFETGLGLLADTVFRPQFPQEEVALVQEQQLGDIRQGLDEISTVASWVAQRAYWGPNHPFAHPIEGTEGSVSTLTRDDVQASWKNRMGQGRAGLVVAGDVSADTILPLLESHFGSWKSPNATLAKGVAPAAGPSWTLVHQPDAAQTVLAVVHPGVSALDVSLQPTMLGITVLGGTFTSRLNRLLREEKGYTYGASAWIQSGRETGVLGMRTSVQRDVTVPAMEDMVSEIKRIAEGIDEAELTKAKGARRSDLVDAMASRGGMASVFATLFQDGRLPADLLAGFDRLESADTTAVNQEMAKVDLDQATVVIVGDLDVIREPLVEAFGPMNEVAKN